ncbi:MAG TPA: ATP-binding protein, partial [Kofleriaceae bacterium]|nr:ATP-binding protein [Kofleriaceae bacterium]
ARYAPPGVIVNDRHEVVQVRGRTGDFLEFPPGQPQVNILKMARHGLSSHLREALAEAQATSRTVRRRGARVEVDGKHRSINVEVTPLAGVRKSTEHYFLIVFEEPAPAPSAPATAPAAAHAPDEENARLRAELAANRDYVQAVAGEHQDTVEELGTANEEFIAANEELQSTNEELQSAKEELQSTNEELNTLNDELQLRNLELDRIAADLVNVLESVQIPVIMVDSALRVRRFTPIAREISGLLPGDVGRSIDDVKLKVRVDDLTERIRAAISANTPREHEVQRSDGRWFNLHIRPYRTTDNRLDGAVLAFLDIDVLKRAAQEAERARDYAQSIVETVPMSLVVLDSSLRIVSANPPFYQNLAPELSRGAHDDFFGLDAGALDVPALREEVERSLAARRPFRDLEVRCTLRHAGARELVVFGCPISGDTGDLLLLLAIEDATERHQLEASEKSARVDAEQANRAKDLFLATLSHELRTPLSTILMSAELLQREATSSPKIRRASAAIERAVGAQARLIDDLLDISRIVSGKLMLDLEAVDFPSVVQAAVDVAEVQASAKGVAMELGIRGEFRPIHGDPARLQQVVANLLTNAVKFTPSGGQVEVLLESRGDLAELTVTDTGIGLRQDMIPHLFDRFVQAESAMTRAHGGLGLGLAIVRHLVEVHGGEVRAESRGDGQGATFTVTLPLSSSEPALPEPRPTVSRSISGIHVLLIEDDDDTREACAAMLEAQGADVRAVSSVAQGLAALEMFMPQVILCDIAMPGEDGYAFIRQLRNGARGREIPAAALTALAGEDDRRHALAAGFQLHLSKPIDAAQLAAAVASLHEWSEPIGPAKIKA